MTIDKGIREAHVKNLLQEQLAAVGKISQKCGRCSAPIKYHKIQIQKCPDALVLTLKRFGDKKTKSNIPLIGFDDIGKQKYNYKKT